MSQQSNPATLRETLAREIADEFCGGSEAIFEAILAKLAASGTEAAPYCGNCGGPTEQAEDRHYYCANPECSNCKPVREDFDSDQIARVIQGHLSLSESDTALVKGYLHRAFVAGVEAVRTEAAPSLLDALNELRIRLCEIGRKEHAFTRALAKQTAREIEKILAAASPEGEGREAQLLGEMRDFANECLRRIESYPHLDGDELHSKDTYEDILKLCDLAALRQSAAPSGEDLALLNQFIGYISVEYRWEQERWENCQALAKQFLAKLTQESKTGAVTDARSQGEVGLGHGGAPSDGAGSSPAASIPESGETGAVTETK